MGTSLQKLRHPWSMGLGRLWCLHNPVLQFCTHSYQCNRYLNFLKWADMNETLPLRKSCLWKYFKSLSTAWCNKTELQICLTPSNGWVRGSEVGWGNVLKSGRSRVRFPVGKLEFFIHLIGLTTLPPSCAQCYESWEFQHPGTIRAIHGFLYHRTGVLDFLEDGTDMRRLTTEIRSEKCVVRRFRRCANVKECTYTNLDSIAYYTPRLYGIVYCS